MINESVFILRNLLGREPEKLDHLVVEKKLKLSKSK